jgi:DNA-binding response OmpR family regulator
LNALLLCDDPNEAAILATVLQVAGMAPLASGDLDKALRAWSQRPADLVLLALHHGSPLEQVRRIRAETEVALAAIVPADDEDVICQTLEAGADLVLARPYSARVLAMQIRALLRRSRSTPLAGLPSLTIGALVLDPSARTVQVEGRSPRRLTQLEFLLLYTLILHQGQTLPTETIIERVWGYGGEGSTELVRGIVSRLRTKIESNRKNPQYILTVPGVGYQFVPGKAAPSAPGAKKPGA